MQDVNGWLLNYTSEPRPAFRRRRRSVFLPNVPPPVREDELDPRKRRFLELRAKVVQTRRASTVLSQTNGGMMESSGGEESGGLEFQALRLDCSCAPSVTLVLPIFT